VSTAARLRSFTLASGDGWLVRDVACTAGPRDRPFEEQHTTISLGVVTSGTFRYRTTQGAALLVPGAVLLGNHERCFECGHEHGTGDRCLSLHFAPEYWESVATAVRGVRRSDFARPSIPATRALEPALAALESARGGSEARWEEAALELAGTVLRVAHGLRLESPKPNPRDERRIAEAVRRIEASSGAPAAEALSLGALAREAALSPYHFLRVFRARVGMTPHQYVLRTRLHRAAVGLRTSDKPIATIAFDAGFNDLSTFNRHFKRALLVSPGEFRRGRPLSVRAGG
jgi:AraC-like DNA-binding protein